MLTPERFFTGVNSEVPIQQLLPHKAVATEFTVERFLVSMCSHSVHCQLVNCGKSLETCLALSRIQSFVNLYFMPNFVCMLFESCIAVAASVRSVPIMDFSVPRQYIEEWKGVVADVTFVVPGSSVGHHVLHHV